MQKRPPQKRSFWIVKHDSLTNPHEWIVRGYLLWRIIKYQSFYYSPYSAIVNPILSFSESQSNHNSESQNRIIKNRSNPCRAWAWRFYNYLKKIKKSRAKNKKISTHWTFDFIGVKLGNESNGNWTRAVVSSTYSVRKHRNLMYFGVFCAVIIPDLTVGELLLYNRCTTESNRITNMLIYELPDRHPVGG